MKAFLSAKLNEAEVLVEAGVTDVLIANQVMGAQKLARLARLARRANLSVCVDDAANVAELGAAIRAEGVKLGVLVEIDIGMGRAGVRSLEAALDLARATVRAPGLHFRGLLGYEGHIVDLPAFDERAREAERCGGWDWYSWDALPKPLFKPVASLYRQGFAPLP